MAGSLLGGCAALPLESPRLPHPSSRSAPAAQAPYREAVGVIHIHTTYSDGSLGVAPIARIANRQGLDFLILTDHNTLEARKEQGWFGSTLVLADTEISTGEGHYVALRLREEVPAREEPQGTIDRVRGQGGLGFIAHPYWPRSPWRKSEVTGFTGVEIYNAVEDISEENPLSLAAWTVLAGSDFSIARWLDRSAKPLALWDRYLARGEPVVGIGAADAHGLQRAGFHLGPYGSTFKLVRDHLLIEGDLTPESVYRALEKGRLFVAHDIVADARRFQFLALARGQARAVMGERLRLEEGLQLYAYLPAPGRMTLLKDGQAAGTAEGQHGWFRVTGPGVYRLEATRKGRPWIYSNPIYVIE